MRTHATFFITDLSMLTYKNQKQLTVAKVAKEQLKTNSEGLYWT